MNSIINIPNQTALLRVQDLSVSYRDKAREITALDHVSFDVGVGEVVCVIGPNGAGKTTLLKCLCGLVIPRSGAIVWEKEANDVHPRRPRLGVLLEGSRSFYWNLTGLENARYFAALKGLPRGSQTEKHIADLFDLLNLKTAQDRLAGTYSDGMRKRLSLLIALLGNPKLLLLDEPTQGLDANAIVDLGQYIHRVAGIGTSILCTSHDLSFVFNIAMRVMTLKKGQLQGCQWWEMADEKTQVVILLAGEAAMDQPRLERLTVMPDGRWRLVGAVNDPELYFSLENLLTQRKARILQIYEQREN